MIVDLHMHERTHSSDSFLSLETMVTIAQEKGLDGICITDHDSLGLKETAESYSEQTGFPIFVGVEYYSLQGDIVAFGIDQLPQGRIDAQDFINLVKGSGGICFSAHPFRNNKRGLEENLTLVKGLDGIEVLNASTSPEANKKAYEYANTLGLQPVGSSDCHIEEKIGHFATYLPETASNLREFIAIFKKGKCRPAVYEDGKYRIVSAM